MRLKRLYATLLMATVLSIGFTSLSYAEVLDIKDEYGEWDEIDVPDEIGNRVFDRYIEGSSTLRYSEETDAEFEWDYYLYDINTMQPVAGGWYKYEDTRDLFGNNYTSWLYSIPGTEGKLLCNSWIIDNGQVYLASSSGETVQNEMIRFDQVAETTPDLMYNIQTGNYDPLPFTQKHNTHHLALPSGGLSYDHFVKTLSGENYAKWLEEQNEQHTGQQNNSSSNLDWSLFDIYIPQAMEDNGYYSYEVVEKVRIDNDFNGIGVYKVKVSQGTTGNSKYIGVLKIYLGANGNYWRSEF